MTTINDVYQTLKAMNIWLRHHKTAHTHAHTYTDKHALTHTHTNTYMKHTERIHASSIPASTQGYIYMSVSLFM